MDGLTDFVFCPSYFFAPRIGEGFFLVWNGTRSRIFDHTTGIDHTTGTSRSWIVYTNNAYKIKLNLYLRLLHMKIPFRACKRIQYAEVRGRYVIFIKRTPKNSTRIHFDYITNNRRTLFYHNESITRLDLFRRRRRHRRCCC